LEIGEHFLRPGLVALEVLVAGEHLAVGRDQVESLVLSRSLLLYLAKKIAPGALGFADLVEVKGDGDAVSRDEADDTLVG
jgi:hypothetical protein